MLDGQGSGGWYPEEKERQKKKKDLNRLTVRLGFKFKNIKMQRICANYIYQESINMIYQGWTLIEMMVLKKR